MFLIVCLIVSLLEIRDAAKEKRMRIFLFSLLIIIFSLIVYLNRNNISSLQTLIEKIKGAFNGKN